MSDIANSEGTSAENEKPVQQNDVKFPPFPEPTDEDFEEDIAEDERKYYKEKFADLRQVELMRLHCSACDRHLGCSTRNESRMRAHPMLRTLVCHTCHTFYNSGEFEKGDDGSELYCRWCGQGGQVYCCSNCPHVFCAKCIKRNLGLPKIKDIENTDDWKCFKCDPKCLWDLRGMCWALLRYCDLKNKITYKTEDQQLKEEYQKDCARDYSECCKTKSRRKEKPEIKNVKRDLDLVKKSVSNVIAKIPSTIQVKKFASINADDISREKKPMKRAASPVRHKPSILIKNPIPIAGATQNMINPINMPPLKKIRMPMINPIRVGQDKKPIANQYTRIRPKPPSMPIPVMSSQFNGYNNNSFNNMVVNDNINLSLESLTQGLDMAAVVAMANNNNSNVDDDVVCTPDFPLEPLCEVTEDNNDDDVQCITPAPVLMSKINTPPIVTRTGNTLPDLSPDNIIQMTENDVTVNTVTGGLKFRVDPQTLSSNKMYRLPDGRIFAINANPNMPGGYSATIVAVTEAGKAVMPKGATYAAKLSAIPTVQTSTPAKRPLPNDRGRASTSKGKSVKNSKVTRGTATSSRECDLQVPVEWYRYNLIDAIDALEYSLSRLNKLKREATTMFLRTRNVDEIRYLHRSLERLLNTSSTRFYEIRDNLNRELKEYIAKKSNDRASEDDDDVEILPDLENDDPIFIDENSTDSVINDLICNESPEVDLTGVGSSDPNDSGENKVDNDPKIIEEPTITNIEENFDCDNSNSGKESTENFDDVDNNKDINYKDTKIDEKTKDEKTNDEKTNDEKTNEEKKNDEKTNDENTYDEKTNDKNTESSSGGKKNDLESNEKTQINGDTQVNDKQDIETSEKECSISDEQKILSDDISNRDDESKIQDTEMSEELIETLLKDDNQDEIDNMLDSTAMDIVESV